MSLLHTQIANDEFFICHGDERIWLRIYVAMPIDIIGIPRIASDGQNVHHERMSEDKIGTFDLPDINLDTSKATVGVGQELYIKLQRIFLAGQLESLTNEQLLIA
jgi:hypothetical protein